MIRFFLSSLMNKHTKNHLYFLQQIVSYAKVDNTCLCTERACIHLFTLMHANQSSWWAINLYTVTRLTFILTPNLFINLRWHLPQDQEFDRLSLIGRLWCCQASIMYDFFISYVIRLPKVLSNVFGIHCNISFNILNMFLSFSFHYASNNELREWSI